MMRADNLMLTTDFRMLHFLPCYLSKQKCNFTRAGVSKGDLSHDCHMTSTQVSPCPFSSSPCYQLARVSNLTLCLEQNPSQDPYQLKHPSSVCPNCWQALRKAFQGLSKVLFPAGGRGGLIGWKPPSFHAKVEI